MWLISNSTQLLLNNPHLTMTQCEDEANKSLSTEFSSRLVILSHPRGKTCGESILRQAYFIQEQ